MVETVEATWSQPTPEGGHICWCWGKVLEGEAWCQMCVAMFHNPQNAAATLSRELFLGLAGTWPQSQGNGNSRVQRVFLGAADTRPLLIRPLLGETLPQRGRTNRSQPQSFGSKGPGKTAASEAKLGREVLPGAWSRTVKKQGVDES